MDSVDVHVSTTVLYETGNEGVYSGTGQDVEANTLLGGSETPTTGDERDSVGDLLTV